MLLLFRRRHRKKLLRMFQQPLLYPGLLAKVFHVLGERLAPFTRRGRRRDRLPVTSARPRLCSPAEPGSRFPQHTGNNAFQSDVWRWFDRRAGSPSARHLLCCCVRLYRLIPIKKKENQTYHTTHDGLAHSIEWWVCSNALPVCVVVDPVDSFLCLTQTNLVQVCTSL